MGWHVVQGMYYFSYGNAQPHTLHGAPGAHDAVIVFKITQGLVSTDKTCNGLAATETNPEVHIDVGGINVIFAGKWGSKPTDEFFATGGQARLFFDKGTRTAAITEDQIIQLEKIFKGKTENPAFDEFESIPTANWQANATLTQPTTINDSASSGSGVPGTFRLINLPSQNIEVLDSTGNPTGTNKPMNPAQIQLNPLERDRDPARADTEFQRLVNAAPKFRLGGQYVRDTLSHTERNLDVEGTTLANSANSFFVDPDLGSLVISGNGEYRTFLYAGADEPHQHLSIMQLLYSMPALIEFMPIFPPFPPPDGDPDKGGFVKGDPIRNSIKGHLTRGPIEG